MHSYRFPHSAKLFIEKLCRIAKSGVWQGQDLERVEAQPKLHCIEFLHVRSYLGRFLLEGDLERQNVQTRNGNKVPLHVECNEQRFSLHKD